MPNYTVKPGDRLIDITNCHGIAISDLKIKTSKGIFDLGKPNHDGFNIHRVYPGDKLSWQAKPLSPNVGSDADVNANSAIKKCLGSIEITIVYGNDADSVSPYMKNSGVLVGGKVKVTVKGIDQDNSDIIQTKITDSGKVTFKELKTGQYKILATYNEKFTLVDKALSYVNDTRWQIDVKKESFDGKVYYKQSKNKCNLFVYDMIQQIYGSAPLYTYERAGGYWFNRTVPDLASSWAADDNSSSDPTEGWENITYRNEAKPVNPGSILGIAANYSNASGHVAIIAYPLDGEVESAVVGGVKKSEYIIMQGQTVSAAGDMVRHNDWGFRTSKRDGGKKSSLNSPKAGIEIKSK